jgi:aspartyl/asparaginyl-tRNA synthetase
MGAWAWTWERTRVRVWARTRTILTGFLHDTRALKAMRFIKLKNKTSCYELIMENDFQGLMPQLD